MSRVPIYSFDEHHHAFYFWHKAKFEASWNGPLDLLHIDAHCDMEPSTSFKQSLYCPSHLQNEYLAYYQDVTQNELKIANFIRPAILTGLIKNVYFIYPRWRRFKAKKSRLNISSAFGEGRVLKHNLAINKKTSPKVLRVFPDLKWFEFFMQKIDKIPENLNVILDIDFDYFACIDSVLNHINYKLQITEQQFNQKEKFLDNQTLPFSAIDFSFRQEANKFYCQISHKKGNDISYLPPEKEIKSEINNLVNTLVLKKIKPKVITLSRSCHSGYCPLDYGVFIEAELRKRLEALA